MGAPIVHFFSSVAHVWVPGAKTTGLANCTSSSQMLMAAPGLCSGLYYKME
jgi:hypothetical protein